MGFSAARFATEENRWYALVVIALALAIVIIDNTVLNVSIPYMLRDLNANLSSIEWVISGYALTIATILITVGRIGDLIGRKKLFILGIAIFATGSFIGSVASDVMTLIIGRAIIQAFGAAMALTSALALLATNFHGRERAIAFGVWGAIAGASASVGPLLGGYLTTYYSWQWSLRINVFVAAIAIIGSVFIRESKGEGEKHFDWLGTVLSGAGLFSLVFGLIEGQKYGWLVPNNTFYLFGQAWPFSDVSIVPFFFGAAAVFLTLFALWERRLEARGRSPLLKPSIFGSRGFTLGLLTLGILSFGMFGVFFMLPIYIENVLGLNAFETGIFLLPASASVLVFGLLSGMVASRKDPKLVVVVGMSLLAIGSLTIINMITENATLLTFAPVLMLYGMGIGFSSAQLSNIILSSSPRNVAGEASATMNTVRQVGASIGIAIIGAMLAGSLITNITANVQADSAIPTAVKQQITQNIGQLDVEGGQLGSVGSNLPPHVLTALKADINNAIIVSARTALGASSVFIVLGAALSFLIPSPKREDAGRPAPAKSRPMR